MLGLRSVEDLKPSQLIFQKGQYFMHFFSFSNTMKGKNAGISCYLPLRYSVLDFFYIFVAFSLHKTYHQYT